VSRTGGPADQRGAWTGPHDVIASQRAILPSHVFGFVDASKSDIGCIIKKMRAGMPTGPQRWRLDSPDS
jgi:hypothetical protein